MIAIQHQGQLVEFAVIGEFTLADFKEFEELVLYKIKFTGPVNLLVDLREMFSFTIDVAWEEIRFSHAHEHEFSRIAVLTGQRWEKWCAWLTRLFVHAEIRTFEEEAAARTWLS
jgi:hypothetical protein